MRRRDAGRLLPVLCWAALLVLAGCSEPASPSQPAASPTPALVLGNETLDVLVPVGTNPGCTQVVCSGGSFPRVLFEASANASIRALDLEIGAVQAEDRPVTWKLTCQALEDEDPGCIRALAGGRDPLPHRVTVAPLNLTPGTTLLLELVVPPTVTPVVDQAVTIVNGQSRVTGTVQVATVGNGSAPVEVPKVTVPVSFDGHSGPCDLVSPGCTHWPGGTESVHEVPGTVVAVNVTMTWTSLSPLDEVLELYVGPAFCTGPCPEPQRVQGRSPLVVDLPALKLPDEVRFAVYHADPTGADPTGFAFVYTGTRTPVHVEGTVTYEPEAEPVEPS